MLQITVTRLYPDGVEPPPKRRQVVEREASQQVLDDADADIDTQAVGDAEPVDTILPESRTDMYAGLGLDSSEED